MLEEVVALIAPPRCAVCGAGCELRVRLCSRCAGSLRRSSPHWSAIPSIDEVWSAAPYEGTVRDLVAAIKFGSRMALADEAAALIAGRAPVGLLAGAIVPVPPAPLRRRKRGFDAAEAIALALAERTCLPLAPCLARAQGPRQVGRRRTERLADPPRVRVVSSAPRRVLLVDDVMTTGATLGACARALRERGVDGVVAATLAASKGRSAGALGLNAHSA